MCQCSVDNTDLNCRIHREVFKYLDAEYWIRKDGIPVVGLLTLRDIHWKAKPFYRFKELMPVGVWEAIHDLYHEFATRHQIGMWKIINYGPDITLKTRLGPIEMPRQLCPWLSGVYRKKITKPGLPLPVIGEDHQEPLLFPKKEPNTILIVPDTIYYNSSMDNRRDIAVVLMEKEVDTLVMKIKRG